VQRGLNKLVEAGLPDCSRGGQGPRDTNRYRMGEGFKGEVEFTLKGGVSATLKRKKGGVRRQKRVAHTPPESRKRKGEGKGESPLTRLPLSPMFHFQRGLATLDLALARLSSRLSFPTIGCTVMRS
jgi:hypothetical protein